jgi:hypothetical protein
VHELCLGVSPSEGRKVSTVTFAEMYAANSREPLASPPHTRSDERTPVETVGILQTVPCSVRPEECSNQGDDAAVTKMGWGSEDASPNTGGSSCAGASQCRG